MKNSQISLSEFGDGKRRSQITQFEEKVKKRKLKEK